MRVALAIGAALALAGCDGATQTTDRIARDSAKKAVAEVIVTRFPMVRKEMVTPYTDCVIDNAEAREIARLAGAAVMGPDEDTFLLVQSIVGRPGTVKCIARQGLVPPAA
jgi:hypothetical protein